MKIIRDGTSGNLEGQTIARAGFTESGDLWLNWVDGGSVVVTPKTEVGEVKVVDVSSIPVETSE